MASEIEDLPWWEHRSTLPFSCTSCGKCCECRGSAWCSPEEAQKIADHLGVSTEQFRELYCKFEIEGWVELRRIDTDDQGRTVAVPDDDHTTGRCVFLTEEKQCSVYHLRPAHCQVFPFFPKSLSSVAAWNAQVVQPDPPPGQAPREGLRLWTKKQGGCEGMRLIQESGVEGGHAGEEAPVGETVQDEGGRGAEGEEGAEDIGVGRVRELRALFYGTYSRFPVEAWRWFQTETQTPRDSEAPDSSP